MMPFVQQTHKFLHRFIEIDIWGWMPYVAAPLLFFQKYVYNDWNFLIFLGVLMAVDLVTGIMKAVRTGGWKSINSKGFRDTGRRRTQLRHIMMQLLNITENLLT
jgi:hypothetical protein